MTAREPRVCEPDDGVQARLSMDRPHHFKSGARNWRLSLPWMLLGVAVMVVSFAVAPGTEGALGGALGVLMLGVMSADARRFVVPDVLSGGASALGAIRAALLSFDPGPDSVLVALSSGTLAAGLFLVVRIVYRRVRGREGLGLGDVKLAGVAGIWLSLPILPVAIEAAAIAALVAYAARQRRRERALQRGDRVPFGAFIAPAIWLGWVVETILQTA